MSFPLTNPAEPSTPLRCDPWLQDLVPTGLQSRGMLEMVTLKRADGSNGLKRPLAIPTRDLKLNRVTNYGTMVLQNTSTTDPLIIPMHVGFFQHGAQNHATSRTLILDPAQELTVRDCFCIQAAQSGFLKHSEQRFMMLPLALRGPALAKSHVQGYDRLWDDIDRFTRQYGVARGGHLERFLRPNFHRLLPLRHGLECDAGQVGAAYFVGGQLQGIEVGPSSEFFAGMLPIYSIYCYGPAALLEERMKQRPDLSPVDLTGILDVEDLSQRLSKSRQTQLESRVDQIAKVVELDWISQQRELPGGYRVCGYETDHWAGQTVHCDNDLAYLSVFRTGR